MSLFGKKKKQSPVISDPRADFPMLEGNDIIYFDSACQSLRPRSVIDAVTEYYERYSTCAGRSNYKLAEDLHKRVEGVRKTIAGFVNAAHAEEIIFTHNTTEGINLIARSLDFNAGDVVVISDKEHNSNLVPWLELKRRVGIEVRIAPTMSDGTLSLSALDEVFKGPVKLASFSLTSNLDGVSIAPAAVAKRARDAGALVLFDAAQTVAHRKLDVRFLDADFVVFSGHKMLGPSGTGVLYGKRELLEKLEPFLVGGETVSATTYDSAEFLPSPQKFEAGLQDYAGILGLGAAVEYIQGIGFGAIERRELEINERISTGIKDIAGITILGPADPMLRGGIVSFTAPGGDFHKVAIMLDELAGIKVRSGQHCVHAWFASRKLPGTVRASFTFYNTLREADIFVETVKKVAGVL